jgi:hypothetical protein
LHNIPDLNIHELSSEMTKSLELAKVGVDRPCLIVSYSMGGILAKEIMVQNEGLPIETNNKGILFIAVPHHGSDVKEKTYE